MNNLLLLCIEFLKTGLFSIGGGLATLPYLFGMAENYPQWFTKQQLLNLIAVSESTPGAIGINMSTYVGYLVGGFGGSLLATFFLVLPSFIIIIAIAHIMNKFQDNLYLKSSLNALKPAVCALIASVAFNMVFMLIYINKTINIINLLFMLAFMLCMFLPKLKSVHPIIYIILGAVLGIVFKL